MQEPVIIIGMGQLGGVFARAFLRKGYPVYPVLRNTDVSQTEQAVGEPALVLVAVAEKDLAAVLERVPESWRNNLGLLQNELLPYLWREHHIVDPTVMSVWFEKKKGRGCQVLLPSQVFGPKAALVAAALEGMGLACEIVPAEDGMLFELVRKNVFVFTINIAGLETEGTVGALWNDHNELARQIADEVIDVQQALTGADFARQRLVDVIAEAAEGDPNHRCRGRAAVERLERMVQLAEKCAIKIPRIGQIWARYSRCG